MRTEKDRKDEDAIMEKTSVVAVRHPSPPTVTPSPSPRRHSSSYQNRPSHLDDSRADQRRGEPQHHYRRGEGIEKRARTPSPDTYSCRGCKETFPTLHDLLKHLGSPANHSVVECLECHTVFPSIMILREHLLLENHMRVEEETDQEQPVQFGESARTPPLKWADESLESHLGLGNASAGRRDRKAGNGLEGVDEPYGRMREEMEWEDASGLARRTNNVSVDGHSPPLNAAPSFRPRYYLRQLPRKSYIHESSIDQQQHESSTDHRCHWCILTFPTAQAIDDHLWEHHLTCDLCMREDKRFYMNERTLRKHQRRAHPDGPYTHPANPRRWTDPDTYHCRECGKIFKKMQDLLHHMNATRRHVRLRCADCHTIFPSIEATRDHLILEKHMRATETDDREQLVQFGESAQAPPARSPSGSPEFEILGSHFANVDEGRDEIIAGTSTNISRAREHSAMDVEVIDLDREDELDGGSDVAMDGDIDLKGSQGTEQAESDSSVEFLPNHNHLDKGKESFRGDKLVSGAAGNHEHRSQSRQETAETASSADPQLLIPESAEGQALTQMDDWPREGVSDGGPESQRSGLTGMAIRAPAGPHHHLCLPCNQATFSTARDVLEHVASAHNDRQSVYCDACAALFFSLTAFDNHLVTYHQHTVTAADIPLADNLASSAIFFYCAACHEFRESVGELLEHRKFHRGAKVVQRERWL